MKIEVMMQYQITHNQLGNIKITVIPSIGEDVGQSMSCILTTEMEMFANSLRNSLILYSKVKCRIKWEIDIVFQLIHV